MKRKRVLTLILSVTFISILGGNDATAQPALDQYIVQGLENNLVLKQKQICLEQARQSLQIARSYFLPSVNILGDYTSGNGGRSIELPIGDLLNPVYASLNELTDSDNFPQIKNVEQNFFPRNFYDARVRTYMPLLNTDLHVSRTINGHKVQLKEYELVAYRRELVFEIKRAYYNYLAAQAAQKTYESAELLVKKNVEVNESLLRNGKNLPAYVLRSKSEAEKIKAELNNARNQVVNAKRYFNFLLNRDLGTEIVEEKNLLSDHAVQVIDTDIERREELAIVRTGTEIQESSLDLYRLSRFPKLHGFIDLGSQAENWQVNNNSRYYLVGVQLTFPVFQGFRNNIQIKQTRLELNKSELDAQNVRTQLQLAAEVAERNLLTARANHAAAMEQLSSARSYFNLIDKGYQQGINSLIEFIDARNQLTSSELQVNLRELELLTAAASLERETSSFNLPN